LGTGPYFEAHVLPTSGEAGGQPSGTEAYYSFDYGNAHFIVLDSTDNTVVQNSSMLDWLQADLAATTQKWVIAYFHHPPYTKGTHDSDSASDSDGRLVYMREVVVPILEAGGVDLVLASHSHNYERSYFVHGAYAYPNSVTPSLSTLKGDGHILDDGDGNPEGDGPYRKDPAGNAGAVYVVAGHGGNEVGGTGGHPVVFFTDVTSFGSLLIDIDGDVLTLRNLRSDGVVTDVVAIDKSDMTGNQAPIVNAGADVNGDGRADYLYFDTFGDGELWVSLSTDSGFMPAELWLQHGASTPDQIQYVDVNGDRKVDALYFDTFRSNGVWVSLSTGSGFTAPQMWLQHGESTPNQIQYADVNGDGKADALYFDTFRSNGVWVSLSTGSGFTAPQMWLQHGESMPNQLQYFDVSGDGKADALYLDTLRSGDVWVSFSTGSSFTVPSPLPAN
jgi:hypothetical protein